VLVGCNRSWRAEDFRAALLNPNHDIWRERAPQVFRVRFETSKGDFVLEAHRAWAPIGVDRFYNLVRTGFYDDSRFFRVRAGFIAQFGLPGDPAVTAVWRDLAMPDDPVVESNTKGSVAYAMTGPDTRTTQLYINLDDNVQLNGQGFAPIARVVAGMDVVESLYAGYDESAGGGMRGGRQGRIIAEGNAHLDAEFPNLDRLIRAAIE
jgi:cyclophilin family peptidyl-prolyl cis-trans isomerase